MFSGNIAAEEKQSSRLTERVLWFEIPICVCKGRSILTSAEQMDALDVVQRMCQQYRRRRR